MRTCNSVPLFAWPPSTKRKSSHENGSEKGERRLSVNGTVALLLSAMGTASVTMSGQAARPAYPARGRAGITPGKPRPGVAPKPIEDPPAHPSRPRPPVDDRRPDKPDKHAKG